MCVCVLKKSTYLRMILKTWGSSQTSSPGAWHRGPSPRFVMLCLGDVDRILGFQCWNYNVVTIALSSDII